jgi:ribonucleoside-diphosphate reductase alpha chain
MMKSNRVLEWACDGIAGVSSSDLAMKASLKIYDGIPTADIHLAFIDAAEELILEDHHYAEVQSRLLIIDLLKKVYGDWDIIKPLSQVVKENTDSGLYDPELYSAFTEVEWQKFDTMIDHKRDYKLMGAGVKQFKDKYLVQDRSTGTLYETPQVAYALCAIAGLKNYKRDNPAARIAQIKETYDEFSRAKVNLPTPVLAGVRQRTKQYSSCVLVDVGDSLNSINTACKIANNYAAKRAGLGINVGRIRPAGSKVGNGEIVHTGIVPYIRQIESSIKSCSQGGIRDASATTFIPIWHYEIEDVLVLKSAKINPDKAVRRLDYCAQWDSYLKRRAQKGEPMTLFSPHEVPDLYEAFYAKELMDAYFLTQGFETGRVYDMNVDHVNTHTPFLEPIYMSNLCMEILLPTKPVAEVHSALDVLTMTGTVKYEGLVQLCTLAAINLGNYDPANPKDMERRMRILIVFLNELLDNQDYATPQAYRATMDYRPLGIGIVNLAYALAKRGMKFGDKNAMEYANLIGEQMYYYALRASCDYAKYKGKKLPAWDKLIYSQGKTLNDTYCKAVDELVPNTLTCDWDTLKADIAEHGLYNSTFGAFMPSESSSTVLNATSGADKIRSIVTEKSNKRLHFKQVAPEPVALRDAYDMLWDTRPEQMDDYLKQMAVHQKWLCLAISINLSYNPEHFEDNLVSVDAMRRHTFISAKYGNKTRYYINTKGEDEDKVEKMSQDTAFEAVEEEDGEGCAGGACKI